MSQESFFFFLPATESQALALKPDGEGRSQGDSCAADWRAASPERRRMGKVPGGWSPGKDTGTDALPDGLAYTLEWFSNSVGKDNSTDGCIDSDTNFIMGQVSTLEKEKKQMLKND